MMTLRTSYCVFDIVFRLEVLGVALSLSESHLEGCAPCSVFRYSFQGPIQIVRERQQFLQDTGLGARSQVSSLDCATK